MTQIGPWNNRMFILLLWVRIHTPTNFLSQICYDIGQYASSKISDQASSIHQMLVQTDNSAECLHWILESQVKGIICSDTGTSFLNIQWAAYECPQTNVHTLFLLSVYLMLDMCLEARAKAGHSVHLISAWSTSSVT